MNLFVQQVTGRNLEFAKRVVECSWKRLGDIVTDFPFLYIFCHRPEKKSKKGYSFMFRKEVRGLIWVYFFISLGGLLLHLRIHPPGDTMFNWVPAIFGAVNAFVLPFLFNSPGTVTWACLFTWATVLTGTVTMAYFSIITWAMPVTVKNVILFSTLADILILMAKLPLAHKILRVHRPQEVTAERRGCSE